jgi:hypothetical protein
MLFNQPIDLSTVEQLLKAPVDASRTDVRMAPAPTLGQMYTLAGTGSTRLLTRIPARIVAGGLGTDPAGTSHVVQTSPGTGLTVGQTLASGWGVTLQILAAAAGSGPTPDRYACTQL